MVVGVLSKQNTKTLASTGAARDSCELNRCDAADKMAALSLVQGAAGNEGCCASKSADAWQSFIAALIKMKSSSHGSSAASSTATPDAALSEVGSSHGGLSPRRCWADEEVDETPAGELGTLALEEVTTSQEDQEDQEVNDDDYVGVDNCIESEQSSPKKRSRRGNRRGPRRRRTRGGRAAASGATAGNADTECFDAVNEEVHVGSGAGRPCSERAMHERDRPCSERDVVVVGDLLLGLDAPATTGLDATATTAGCQSPAQPSGAQADSPLRAEPAGILSTPPRAPELSPLLLDSQEVAWTTPMVPHQPYSSPLASVSPSPSFYTSPPGMGSQSGCTGNAQACLGTGIIACTTPLFYTGDATLVGQPSAGMPVGVCMQSPGLVHNAGQAAPFTNLAYEASHRAMLSSPCRAWEAPTGGIVSTLPMVSTGPYSPAGAIAGAGSPSADILRSWLHASGLPSTADLVAQLQAAAPDVYED